MKYYLLLLIFLSQTQVYAQKIHLDSIIHFYQRHGAQQIAGNFFLKGSASVNSREKIFEEIKISSEKYPTVLLSEIRTITIAGQVLDLMNRKFAGFNSGQDIYIATKSNPDIEKTFHQQFSILLLNQHPGAFDTAVWKQLENLSSFRVSGGHQSKFFPKNTEIIILQNGFLNADAARDWVTDFGYFAESLFAGGKDFWGKVNDYPRIREKSQLVIQFYHSLAPIFTEAWFRFLAEYRLF